MGILNFSPLGQGSLAPIVDQSVLLGFKFLMVIPLHANSCNTAFRPTVVRTQERNPFQGYVRSTRVLLVSTILNDA